MRIAAAALTLVLCGMSVCCGHSSPMSVSSPTAPVPPATPTPAINIAGDWSGTLESANLSTRTITMKVVQGGNCVDGVWAGAGSNWSGAISGFAGADSFIGQISIETVTDAGQRCNAVATTSGEVGDETLRWTSTGFSGTGQCSDILPTSIVISLHRM